MLRIFATFILFLAITSRSTFAEDEILRRDFGPKISTFWHPATAQDDRPPNVTIDTVVLHATERRFLWQVIEYFERPTAKASAHFTIDKTGVIAQHVEVEKRAWHAGISKMKDGRESVNDFSIEIELVNLNDGKDTYPKSQLEALRELLAELKRRYPITSVVLHSEIAIPPGRKTDPMEFNMDWIDN